MTTSPAKPNETQPAPPPSKASTIRLIVLLGVLATVVVMLLVDLLIFKPGAEQARNKLDDAVTEKMRSGVPKRPEGEENVPLTDEEKEGMYLTEAEVEKVVGRSPLSAKISDDKNNKIQTFAWWGYIPLNRHRFEVLYRKNTKGTWIYESHDGTQEFPAKLEDVKPTPATLPVRPDPMSSEGTEDNKGDGLDSTPPTRGLPASTEPPAPTEPPATDPPATETPAPAGREGNP